MGLRKTEATGLVGWIDHRDPKTEIPIHLIQE